MVEWADNIEAGTSIEDVKKNQPDFIIIDWDNPIEMDSEIWYEIVEIKGNRDVLKMQNFLAFKKLDGYITRFARK